MYALNLAEDNRILSATLDEFAPEEQPRVEELPEGDITDYKYIDGEYEYDPLPKPEPIETPSLDERLNSLENNVNANVNSSNETDESLSDNDIINCGIYESNTNDDLDTAPFARAYARRIIRCEIDVEDVPASIKDDVEAIIDNKDLCLVKAEVTNGLVNNIDKIRRNYDRKTVLSWVIVANSGYRLPKPSEISEQGSIKAYDSDGKVIKNYHNNLNYTVVENQAICSVYITENCASIEAVLNCVEIELKEDE